MSASIVLLRSQQHSSFAATSVSRGAQKHSCIRSRVHGLPDPNLPREMPGGAFWLPRDSTTSSNLLFGQDFILQRQKARPSPADLATTTPAQICATEHAEQYLTGGSAHQGEPRNLWDVDITDYTVLGERGLLPGVRTPFLLPGSVMTVTPAVPATTCTGMILHPSSEREPKAAPEEDKNPRRTKKVKFTCKICDTTTVKRVSPHGWSRGTVLARCDGCDNIHKLWDHLKVFHELKGNVFPSKLPKDLKIPEGLPQKPGMTHHVHPAVYPHISGEDTS